MALTENIQNDKFPYLARQITGDIAKAFGYGVDHVYETDQAFINFLSQFSIENLSGEWLDKLGVVLGEPRPWVTKPELEEAFQFDIPAQTLDGRYHGFSTSVPITIDGVQYDRTVGGLLDDLYRSVRIEKIGDQTYRRYLTATCLLKRVRSVNKICDVVEVFVNSQRYALSFNSDYGRINDIIITLPATLGDYQQALQNAFNKIFTTSPTVFVDISLYFDELYTVPAIESVVEEITSSSDFEITYEIVDKKSVFTITLDSSLSSYEDEVRAVLTEKYAPSADVVIVVEVA